MGDLKISVDDREFQRTLARYLGSTSKTIYDALGNKAAELAFEALRKTDRVTPQKIERELKRNGLVFKIINATRRQQGLRMLNRAEMKKEAARFIAARKRSSAFIRSGWIPALKVLFPRFKRRAFNRKDTRDFGKPNGYVRIVNALFRPSFLLANATATNPKAHSAATRGLEKAKLAVILDMKNYFERKLKKSFLEANRGA